MDILIFKTTLTRRRLNALHRPLSDLLKGARWNVDWEDCDRVLRIETDKLSATTVETYLRTEGVHCEELM